MNKILPLENPIMNYAWGSRTFIPALFGEATPSEEPQAELWMGAHPKAPSRIGDRTLIEVIADNPVGMLGAATAERFQNRLPFLFKLLAAGTPLSIQAHPNKVQAESGFAAENTAGLALDAPNRNYKDENHKPEILCALSEFWGLNGFREIPQVLELLDEAELDTMAPEFASFRTSPNRDGLKRFFQSAVELNEARKQSVLDELLASARKLEATRPEYSWILRIYDLYPGDIGVLCVLLLNLVKLEPGQAMFAAAGDLHAYLDGFGIELMANSDNVLRGGLTPKHVDIPELMKTLTFRDGNVEVLEPINGRFATATDEFTLSVLEVDGPEVKRPSRGFEILINVRGNAAISQPGGTETLSLRQGASVAIPATVEEYGVSGSARLYVAGVPDT